MSSELRLGLVGAGAIAQLAHLPLLARMRGAQLVAICDNDCSTQISSTQW
jgi:predicted dehydrogenase